MLDRQTYKPRGKENEFDFKKTPEKKATSPLRPTVSNIPTSQSSSKTYYEIRIAKKEHEDTNKVLGKFNKAKYIFLMMIRI